MLLCVAMVLGTMGTVVLAEDTAEEILVNVSPVEVTTYEELLAALDENNANVIMMNDITADATQSSGYGVAGIVLEAGDVLDGQGNTLTIRDANTTWDCAVAMRGGEVKNLTIAGAMRGVFMPGANGDVVIDNCIFKDVIYTFNSDAGSKDYTVTVKNSVLNGWTSFSDVHKSVTFENCTFGEGSGYAYCRPYQATEFKNCNFDEGFKFDATRPKEDNSLVFDDCTYNDEALSIGNGGQMFSGGGSIKIDENEIDIVKNAVAYVGNIGYTDLQEVLKTAGASGAGDTTIEIVSDIDLANVVWTPVNVDGYHGADIVTINGNGHKITNLSAPLFSGGFAGGSGIVINDLTIKDSQIVSTNTQGSGAFIECSDSMDVITLDNCHLLNSSVTGSRTGGLVGWTAGYNNVNDGPVKSYVTFTDCSVVGCTITGTSVGAINGHAGANAWTYTKIEDCKIEDNKLISTDDGGWRVGVVVGTANVGQVAINDITESNNTLTQGDVVAKEGQTNLVGRFVPSSKEEDKSNLVINDVAYTAECKPFAVTLKDDNGIKGYDTLVDALTAAQGDISIELAADATLDITAWETLAIGSDTTNTITINGNNNTLTFNKLNSDWNHIATKNNAKLVLNDMTVEDSGRNNGPWNRYDINFACNVELNNVISVKAMAFKADATLNDVTINESGDNYAIWISANGQEVAIDGLTINSAGRGIKIDDQYVGAAGKVNLSIENATFTTAKKAAIMIKSTAGAEITATKCDISKVAADSENLVWIDEDGAAGQKLVTVNGKPAFVENQMLVLGEDMYFAKITHAVNAAQPGDVIKLLGNISEKAVIEDLGVAALALNDDAIVIDLAGYTLNGYILIQDANKNIEIKNGNIVNEDNKESAVESVGKVTLTNVNITSARHAVNIEGGEAEINGGNYSLITTAGLTQNVIGAEKAKVTINGGVFTGPKGTASDSGAAVAAKEGADVTINGGKFSGGKNNTLAKKDTAVALIVKGGSFDQDPTAYVADGYDCIDTGAYEDRYIVVDRTTSSKIEVIFEPTEEKNVYNIKLVSADEFAINEFVAAEFKFENNSTTVGNKDMAYEISGITENGKVKTVVEQAAKDEYDNEQYIIRIPSGEEANRLSGKSFVIGQVKFIGQATTQFQGNIDFKILDGEVDATREGTHLGKYYTFADGTLILDGDAKINSTISEIKRDVTVNVAFNHNIDTANYWKDYQITATLKNNFGYNKTLDIKITDIKSGAVTFHDVPLGQISVTLEAPGFRTYTHKTVVEETADNGVLVLNFWNDVKRNDNEVIESGKKDMAHNFLVGDIVMDYTVDKYDLAAVTSYYGTYDIDKAQASKYIKYDLNRDGDIDIRDVHYVLHTMGN